VSPLPAASSTPQLKIRSPFVVVVADPLDRLAPVPVASEVTSNGEEVATPMYSWIPRARKAAVELKFTVTVVDEFPVIFVA